MKFISLTSTDSKNKIAINATNILRIQDTDNGYSIIDFNMIVNNEPYPIKVKEDTQTILDLIKKAN